MSSQAFNLFPFCDGPATFTKLYTAKFAIKTPDHYIICPPLDIVERISNDQDVFIYAEALQSDDENNWRVNMHKSLSYFVVTANGWYPIIIKANYFAKMMMVHDADAIKRHNEDFPDDQLPSKMSLEDYNAVCEKVGL